MCCQTRRADQVFARISQGATSPMVPTSFPDPTVQFSPWQIYGHTMAYVAQGSASGWLFPASRLLEEGIHPLDDVVPVWAGDHNEVINKVKSGEAHAGATTPIDTTKKAKHPTTTYTSWPKVACPHDAYVLGKVCQSPLALPSVWHWSKCPTNKMWADRHYSPYILSMDLSRSTIRISIPSGSLNQGCKMSSG